jgi:hypothetical protein
MGTQSPTKLPIPNYLALDETGVEYARKAVIIGELRHPEILPALKEATEGIGISLGLVPVKDIPFGVPVFTAFGLTLPQAKRHAFSRLLTTCGENVPLMFCASYN